jgi:hypothetical protein
MTWLNDGDGWRDESSEGPYDTLKTYLPAVGELQVFRGYEDETYRITYDGKFVAREESVALAKLKAEQWYRENILKPDTEARRNVAEEER